MSESIASQIAAARRDVTESTREINSVKAALLKLDASTYDSDGGGDNTVQISWISTKVNDNEASNGGIDDARLSLQLSSPVEEAFLYGVSSSADDSEKKEGIATFKGVELSAATLSVCIQNEKNPSIVIGKAADIVEMEELCVIEDPLMPKEEYVKDFTVKIETGEDTKAAAAEDEKEDTSEDAKDDEQKETEGAAAEKKEKDSKIDKVVYTLSFRLTYKPSLKDQKEQLVPLLNKAGERRDDASKKLRELVDQQQSSSTGGGEPSSGAGTMTRQQAVKPGFLNNNKSNKKETKQTLGVRIYDFYEKYAGPQSVARRMRPLVQNYIIFFGTVIFLHFRGQEFALPAPA